MRTFGILLFLACSFTVIKSNFLPRDTAIIESVEICSHKHKTEAHEHSSWGYKNTRETYDPKSWKHKSPECGKNQQSPILLHDSLCSTGNFNPVKFYKNGKSTEGKVSNNGHSLVFTISTSNERPLRMKDGPLVGEFVAEQFHFHWGSRRSVRKGLGSEHYVFGKRTVSEMHIVTFNSKYRTFADALKHPDGLAVFGVLFGTESSDDSPVNLKNLKLKKLIKKGSSVKIPASQDLAFDLMEALNKKGFTRHYFTYSGSLTTPPCSEVVQWIVSKKIASLPRGMLNAMQKLKDESGNRIVDNFRPLQKSNRRNIICV